jgi:hypothetical protein
VKGKEKVEQFIPESKEVQSNVANEVIKIGSNDVVMGDCFKDPIIINGHAPTQNNIGSDVPPP